MNWENLKLGDTLILQRGYDLPIQDRREGNIPIVGSAGITGYHNKAKVEGGGVTLGRSGNSFGQVFYCKEDFWPHNAALYVKDYKGNSKKFIYYFLKNMDFSNYNSGSAQPSLNRNFIYPIPVKFPKLEIQQKITSILSAYDDLIENNLKRIKLLEEAAQHLYKEWFVNFRFPGSENKPLNKETGLPEGWEKINLFDFAEIQTGYSFKAKDFNDQKLGKPAIRIRDIPNQNTNTYTTEDVDDKYIVEQGDIVIGMDGFFYLDVWGGQRGLLVQRVCRLRSNSPGLQGFLLEALREPISFYEKTISGATVAHLGKKHLKEIYISVPQSESLKMEMKIFNRMNQKKINLLNMNRSLKEARDLLLPRLMNRSIEV